MENTKAAFIAGFFDGEGSIGINNAETNVSVKISMSQKRPEVLQMIQSFLPFQTRLRQGGNDMWKLSITKARNVLAFIRIVVPYSIRKKDELAAAFVLAGTTQPERRGKGPLTQKEKAYRRKLAHYIRGLR